MEIQSSFFKLDPCLKVVYSSFKQLYVDFTFAFLTVSISSNFLCVCTCGGLIGTAGSLLFQSRPFYIRDEIVLSCCFICYIKSPTIIMKITGIFMLFSSGMKLYQAVGVLPGYFRAPKIGLHQIYVWATRKCYDQGKIRSLRYLYTKKAKTGKKRFFLTSGRPLQLR